MPPFQRRYAGAKMERRGVRGARDADGVATYQSILGALLLELWDARLGIATVTGNVDTWTGQIQGIVLQAPSGATRPVYAADGSNFRGLSVVQSVAASSKCLITANLTAPQLFATGTRPWLWSVCRMVTIGAGNNTWIEIVDNPVTRAQPVLFTLSNALRSDDGATSAASAGYADTTVHQYASGYSPAGAIQLIKDTAVLASAGSGLSTLNSGGTKLSVGAAFNGTSPADVMFATVLAISAQPSAAQQSALLALDKAIWGF